MPRSPEKFTRREVLGFGITVTARVILPNTCLLTDILKLIDPPPTSTPTRTPRPTSTPTSRPTETAIPSTPTSTATPEPTETPTPQWPFEIPPITEAPVAGKWILVDLSDQTLVAYEGTTPVQAAWVSTGVWQYPTRTGDFYIQIKLVSDHMSGDDYNLPNVPHTMYYDLSDRGYAIHGAYWHENFGHPMSHGCINMDEGDAERLYGWAIASTPDTKGTLVRIQP